MSLVRVQLLGEETQGNIGQIQNVRGNLGLYVLCDTVTEQMKVFTGRERPLTFALSLFVVRVTCSGGK